MSLSPGPCPSHHSGGGHSRVLGHQLREGPAEGGSKAQWARMAEEFSLGCRGSQEWRWAGGGHCLSRLGPGRAGGGEPEFASAQGGWLRAASCHLWECPVFLHVQPLPPGSPLGVQPPLPGSLRASVAASQAGDPGLASHRFHTGGWGADPLSPGGCWFTSLLA